jgi:hypothetical protein
MRRVLRAAWLVLVREGGGAARSATAFADRFGLQGFSSVGVPMVLPP